MDNIEKVEAKLSRLRNEIAIMEKQINMADTEQRVTTLNNKSELKKNSLEMKQLRMQVEELQARLKRQQLSDDQLIQEALYFSNNKMLQEIKGKPPEEIIRKLESRVLDLNFRSNALSQQLKILERTYRENENSLKDMVARSIDYDVPSEEDCLKHIRQLENEHHKLLKNIEDTEYAKSKLKIIQERLRKKEESLFRLLMDLKKEKSELEIDDDEIVKKHDELKNKTLNEKEIQLNDLEEKLDFIRGVTGSYDVKDIDLLFLEQKQMKEDFTELKRKAEKRLEDLKSEKRGLTSKLGLMKGTDDVHPKEYVSKSHRISSDEETMLAKNRLKEQKIRCDSAKEELERLNDITSRAREVLQRLIHKLQKKVKKGELDNKSVSDLAKQLENCVIRTFQDTDINIATKKNNIRYQ